MVAFSGKTRAESKGISGYKWNEFLLFINYLRLKQLFVLGIFEGM